MTTNNKFEALEDESIEEGKTVEGKQEDKNNAEAREENTKKWVENAFGKQKENQEASSTKNIITLNKSSFESPSNLENVVIKDAFEVEAETIDN